MMTLGTPDRAASGKIKASEIAMSLPGGYRPAHNPVLMLDPQGNTVDWSNAAHVRNFATAIAAELARCGVYSSR